MFLLFKKASFTVLLSFLFFVRFPLFLSLAEQVTIKNNNITIDDKDIVNTDKLSTESLVGYRKTSLDVFRYSNDGQVGLPTQTFKKSAKNSPEIKSTLSRWGKDPAHATVPELYAASVASPTLDTKKKLYLPTAKTEESLQAIIDSSLIANLPKTELFQFPDNSNKPKILKTNGEELLEVNPDTYSTFQLSYAALEESASLPSSDAQQRFSYASNSLAAFPQLISTTEFEAGQVTFGNPLVLLPREMKMVIPNSITSKGDVYWIQFAVSFHDVELSNINQLIFGVTAPNAITALELIPLRFDNEQNVTRTFSNPEIKLQGGEVEIGKFFEQQVSFKVLKPTIIATGLQENQFSWSLENEAILPGAKRFIVILQVPRGRKSLVLQLQASARTNSSWHAQGNIISTKPKLLDLPLN